MTLVAWSSDPSQFTPPGKRCSDASPGGGISGLSTPNRRRAQVLMDETIRITGGRTVVSLDLIGGVGAEWTEAGRTITALSVASTLRRDRHATIMARIDSPGGNVAEAQRIHEEMLNHRGLVVATVSRRCHSAAGLLLVAAGKRVAAPKARFLLHPAGFLKQHITQSRLDAKALRRLADEADEATQQIVETYAARCAAPPSWFLSAIAAERTIGSMMALNVGLVSEIDGMPWIKPRPSPAVRAKGIDNMGVLMPPAASAVSLKGPRPAAPWGVRAVSEE